MNLTKEHGFLVAGHRGDKYNFYENTIPSFELAIANGADMVETDVRVTKDGVLVLMHDENTKRTTGIDAIVGTKTYEELKQFNAGDKNNFCAIPTLEELLVLVKDKGIMLNLEIKEYYSETNKDRCEFCIDESVKLVEKYGLADKMVFNSFDAYVLEYIHKKYNGKYMLHGFYPYSIMKNVVMDPDEYLYCACIFDDNKKEHYDYLASKGIEPWIGAGVTVKEHLALCLENGARLITTDNPADAIKKLKELKAI